MLTDRAAEVSWPAIGAGALAAVLATVPVALAYQGLEAADVVAEESNWVFVANLLIFVGLGLGGWIAARRGAQPELEGALAALAAVIVVQTVSVLRLALAGDDLRLAVIPFNLVLGSACGLAGAIAATRRRGSPA